MRAKDGIGHRAATSQLLGPREAVSGQYGSQRSTEFGSHGHKFPGEFENVLLGSGP